MTAILARLAAPALGLGLALVLAAPAQAAPGPRPASFAMCGACHQTTAGARPTIGPNLWGVGGRKAGTAPGYAYSEAMKKSGITWNRQSIMSFIAAPMKVVPGTKMTYSGQKDAAQAGQIADYLLSLR